MKQETIKRNYNEISPSAKSLLLLKGITNIPFAKECAAFISLPGKYDPDTGHKDLAYWKRVVHFESRYWSVDQLLSQLSINNIIELSSGYSFRGLDTVRAHKVHYIDTDLLPVIEQKKSMLPALQADNTGLQGTLTMAPLNALDEVQFNAIIDSFPEGPVTIVNEGLLMYLNDTEKERLCKIIYKILQKRGGYWITGDIYIKSTLERFSKESDDHLKELLEQQKIEDNMFASFETAAAFFNNAGFVIDAVAAVDYGKLSSLKYLLASATEEQLHEMQSHPTIQKTWRLMTV